MIVEAEAYIGEDDPACHAAPGPTKRNEPLYGPPGIAYVYLNYGMHYLVNAVTEAKGSPAAVLIRALQPLDGIELMTKRRRIGRRLIQEAELCRGPGNLTKALGITLRENRLDLTSSRLWIEDRGLAPGPVSWGSRLGITRGAERPWRCWLHEHPSVSGRRIE
jgi:DNA-3-methyladenine glycosylase